MSPRSVWPLLVSLLGGQSARGACAELFVSNEVSGDLSVIDARSVTVVATIPLGRRPRGLKLGPDGRLLYVTLSGALASEPSVENAQLPPTGESAAAIGVIDVVERRLVRALHGVSDPEQLAVSADGATLFVPGKNHGEVVMLDAHSGAVRTRVTIGAAAEGFNLSPDGRFVYVTTAAQCVTVLDSAKLTVAATLGTGLRPRSTAFSADGARAYVMNEAGASITEIDAGAHRVLRTLTLAPGLLPMSGAVSPDGATLYVSAGCSGRVLAIDTARGDVRASVESGARPWGLALSPDGSRLYAANGPSNDVTVVDTHDMRVLARLRVGAQPWGIACAAEVTLSPGNGRGATRS
jgi:YVTN family beta-propeller protein